LTGTRPAVGLREVIPQYIAGIRTLPPRSDPETEEHLKVLKMLKI
jgi:hypothetical protein